MGLYDDRLADLSESRSRRRPAGRAPISFRSRPAPVSEARSSTSVQSLLFDRSMGWSSSKAKAWAKSHGYAYGKVDVTDQYIRIRQFDPKGSKVKRTVPFGRGIRAVVAREEMKSMATVKASRRRRRRPGKAAKKVARRRPRRRRVRAVAAKVAAPKRRRRRRAAPAAAPRKRRRRRVRAVAAATPVVKTPRKRRRSRRRVKAWRGDVAGHKTAARKGWARKKKRGGRRRGKRRARENVMEASRRTSRRSSRRRSRGMFERRGNGTLGVGGVVLMVASGGLGFVFADGIDRLLATYNPSSTEEKPKDKFTSDGNGTLANTLNIASMPGWMRLAAGVGITAVPAVGAAYVKNPLVRASLEGAAFGAGISTFKTLWNNIVMPLLLPKETDTATLQKSYIARLYPAESAARINTRPKAADGSERTPEQIEQARRVSSAGSGALSDQDVGPFALSGDSPYPDAGQALRQEAGLRGDSPYPDAAQALRGGLSGDSPYPDAAQALRAGVSAPAYEPGPPAGPGPGPQADPHKEPECACLGDEFLGFVGDAQEQPQDMLFNNP